MRRARLHCVLITLVVLGCRQGTAPDSTPSDSAPGGPSPNNSEQAAPVLGGDAGRSLGDSSESAGGHIELGSLTLTAPTGWDRKPLSSSFVVAEFALPRAEGDDADGRLTISTAGGSVEANIDRWKGQFAPQPTAASQEDVEVAGLKVTIVDLAGDFNDQRGPFAPATLRPNYRMIAAVIPIDDQLHFLKATGPQKTVALHAEAIYQFIRSARPTK